MTNDEAIATTKRAAKIIYAENAPAISLEVTLPTITALVGNLQLALRHPMNVGASRQMVERFLIDLIEKADPSKGDVYKLLMLGFDTRFDELLDDVPAGELFTIAVSCPACGKKSEERTDNPAIVHKTKTCSDCAEKTGETESPDLDWTSAKSHLDETIKTYEYFLDTPGVNTQLALDHVLRPLAERYESGERSEELYDAMMNVE